MNGRFIVGPDPRVAVYISLVKSHRRVLPRRRWGEIGRIAAGRIQRVSYRVRGNARAFLMRIKSKRAVKPECKTAMATCNRYSTRAVRSNRMRLRSHELPLAQPRVLRGGADLCAICARGCGRAASRYATRVRESLDNKEIGRRRDRRDTKPSPPRWNFERVLRRPRHGEVVLSACTEGRGDVVVVCSLVGTNGRGRRVSPPMPASEEGLIFFVNICRLPPARRKSWEICIIGGTRRKRNIAVRWLGSRPSRAASAEYTAEGEAEETDCIGKIP